MPLGALLYDIIGTFLSSGLGFLMISFMGEIGFNQFIITTINFQIYEKVCFNTYWINSTSFGDVKFPGFVHSLK